MTLPVLVAAQAARCPQRLAVVGDEETLSYAALSARARQIAAWARDRGAARGRLVAVALPLSPDLVAALVGVLATGAACVPVDPGDPPGWTTSVLETVAPVCLLTSDDLPAPLPASVPAPPPGAPAPADPDDLAWVQFVPADGAPAGVMLTHRALAAAARGSVTACRHADGLVLGRAPGHGDPAPGALLAPLTTGGTLLLPGPDGLPPGWRPAFSRVLPAELAGLAAAPDEESPSGELAVCGPLPGTAALAHWRLRHPGVAVTVEYGAAETAGAFARRRLAPDEPGGGPAIGHPVPGLTVHLLDQAGDPVTPGQVGEATLTGDQVARGYLGRPDLTADRFGRGPHQFRTGHLMRRRCDGTLELVELAGRAEAPLRAHGARVTPADAGGQDERSVTAQWQQVFDALYRDGAGPADDFSGWTSSYDGRPIPLEEMREWRDATVDRIMSLRPRRLLEIGAGTGLMLSRLAPGCEQYWATDISAAAVERLRPWAGRGVVLRHQAAHDLDGLPPGRFDLVVLNSVAQYFPSRAYLTGVLSGLGRLLAPGGAIFVGDVRNLRTWRYFRAAVRLTARGAAADPASLLAEISRDMALDAELLVDPDFFARWPAAVADIRVKRGRYHNELTRHRYDVIIRPRAVPGACAPSGPAAAPFGRNPGLLRWGPELSGLADLDRRLAAGPDDPVRVTGIPNARLAGEVTAWRLLSEAGNVPAARRALAAPPGPGVPDPEDLIALARRHARRATVTWTAGAPDGALDVLFTPVTHRGSPVLRRSGPAAPGPPGQDDAGPSVPYQPGPAGAWPLTSTPITLTTVGSQPAGGVP